MGVRYNALKAVVSDFSEHLTLANGYDIEPVKVYDSAHILRRINQFPSLCVFLISDPIIADTSQNGESLYRSLTFGVIGITNNDIDMLDLSEAVEEFIYNDENFRYRKAALIEPQSMNFAYGDSAQKAQISTFDLVFRINHNL